MKYTALAAGPLHDREMDPSLYIDSSDGGLSEDHTRPTSSGLLCWHLYDETWAIDNGVQCTIHTCELYVVTVSLAAVDLCSSCVTMRHVLLHRAGTPLQKTSLSTTDA